MNFSPEYLEKYAKGQLSAKEMHSLEKAMQQNPFLAEAVTGMIENKQLFDNHSFPTQIRAIQQQMPYNKEQKLVPLFAALKNYKIAASVALLLTMTALIWFFASPTTTKQMTGEAKAIAQAEQANEMPIPSTATMPEGQKVETKEVEKQEIANKTANNSKEKPKVVMFEQTQQAESLGKLALKPEQEKTTIKETLAEKSKEKDAEISSSQDSNNFADDEESITKDMAKNDTNSDAKDQADLGNSTINKESKQINEQSRELSAARSRKENITKPALLANTEATPSIGWEAYHAYLEKNRKQIKDNPQGITILELTIDKEGSILAIEIVKSVSEEADAEAKRLVQTGGKWLLKGTKNIAKVQVEIKF
jgi:hypothetical protein